MVGEKKLLDEGDFTDPNVGEEVKDPRPSNARRQQIICAEVLKRTYAATVIENRDYETELHWLDSHKPDERDDCLKGERPCPHISCKFHTYLDVHPRTGAITLNFPGKELSELPETCVLDVADRGKASIVEICEVLNIRKDRAERDLFLGKRKLKSAKAMAEHGDRLDASVNGNPSVTKYLGIPRDTVDDSPRSRRKK